MPLKFLRFQCLGPGSPMRFGYETFFDSVHRHINSRRLADDDIGDGEVVSRVGLFLFSDYTNRDVDDEDDITSSAPDIVRSQSSTLNGSTSQTASSNGNGRRKKLTPELLGNCYFTTAIDRYSEAELVQLDKLWDELDGHQPSRRMLKTVSDRTGIAQSKIKRWFERNAENHNHMNGIVINGTSSNDSTPKKIFTFVPIRSSADEMDAILKETEDNLEQVKELNAQISQILYTLNNKK
jgi:hypothetical protein